jgi:hypothetical protein
MTDLRALSDDEVIAMIEVSRGFDRELLVRCLGQSRGTVGVPYLLGLLHERGPGSGHLRAAVLGTLAVRLGQDAAPALVDALSGGTLDIQVTAALLLEEIYDGRSAEDLLAWLRRRVRNPRRENSAGDYELSGVLRYLHRVQQLPAFLRFLDADLERLLPWERRQLDEVWPPDDRRQFLSTTDALQGPDPEALDAWFRLSAGPIELPAPDQPMEADEFEETAIRRARRRLQR